MTNWKTIARVVIGLLIIVGIYQGFFKKTKSTFNLAEVVKGTVTQEVTETGQVKKGEEINLSFKTAGRIEKIWVVVGEEVKEGDILAKLEMSQLKIQLQEAKATLDLAQAKLNKLLAGPSPEEIQLAKTKVSNAQISLKAAQQNLEDVQAQAKENLAAAYQDALNILDDSYLKVYNASNLVDLIQRTYFTVNDQEGIKVRENKDKIKTAVSTIQGRSENIDTALSETEKSLKDISNALKIIRETCEEPNYRNVVSSADKTSLDTQRGYINTALTNITNSQQIISSTKLTNETNLNTIMAKVSSAEGSLKAAQDELTLLVAPPRQEDIDLHQAQVNQAQAQVNLLENQIAEAVLTSPTKGQITKINKRVGETVQPMLQDVVITLLPAEPFQIEVDIYEEDVVKMEVGNLVEISLVAFPEKKFKGKVISIDPASKIIEGVVYYEVTIGFDEIPEGLKPGMTADLTIVTASKENVLIIPEETIEKKNGKNIVRVFKNGVVKEREIEIGLLGSNGLVEVISGLEEGEEIILEQ